MRRAVEGRAAGALAMAAGGAMGAMALARRRRRAMANEPLGKAFSDDEPASGPEPMAGIQPELVHIGSRPGYGP